MTLPRLLLFVWLGFAAGAAHGQEFPELTGRVVDRADYLDPAQEAALTERLAALEERTGRQMVVVTLPNLRGGGDISYPEDDFTYRLGREWGIGDEARDDGVILLVADEERRVRIEVGYGLEPVLTDALSSTIIRNEILPRFREGDMASGVIAGADAVLTQLELPEEEAAARQEALLAEANRGDSDEMGFGGWLMLIFWAALFLWMMSRAARRGAGIAAWTGAGLVSGWSGGGGWSSGGGGWSGGGGGFSGGGGGFGGGGASGGW